MLLRESCAGRMRRPSSRWLAMIVLLAAAAPGLAMAGSEAELRSGLSPVWRPAAAQVPAAGARLLTVTLARWEDQRPDAPGRRLGEVRAAVFGHHERDLRLARDATAVMDDAVRDRLAAQGFALVASPQGADLQLEAALQSMSLTVAGRDERRIALQATLRRAADGKVLWTGTLEDRDDRFAGVSGNSRADLERYLGEGIANVAQRLALIARESTGDAAPAAARGEGPAAAGAAAPAVGVGLLSIATMPPRAKVYVDDVYHGLSPLTLELPTGVTQVNVKLDGFRAATERVAVRRGATIELEMKLER